MTPKTPKDFTKPTAEALELPQGLVDDIVSFYWSAVRKALSEMESPSITVANLGTFKVRYNKISRIEQKYNTYLENLTLESMTFNQHTVQNISKHRLERLEVIRQEMEDEYARKEEVRLKRKAYVTNKNLEE